MVKGVNKNIIEVNETNNEFFEKIVFYLAPKYASLDVKAKEIAFKEMEKNFFQENGEDGCVSKAVKYKSKRKLVWLLGVSAVLLLGLGAGLLFYLNII